MAEWALKVGSAVTTLLVLVAGYAYASTNVKNPNAPLQPPVETSPAAAKPAAPTPTPIPSHRNASREPTTRNVVTRAATDATARGSGDGSARRDLHARLLIASQRTPNSRSRRRP